MKDSVTLQMLVSGIITETDGEILDGEITNPLGNNKVDGGNNLSKAREIMDWVSLNRDRGVKAVEAIVDGDSNNRLDGANHRKVDKETDGEILVGDLHSSINKSTFLMKTLICLSFEGHFTD